MEIWYLLITEKFLFWSFRQWEIRSFLRQKVDGKLIFTDYLKVLVFNFSVMGNTVFVWVKKLIERWSLLVTEKFLFWTFRWLEIRSYFQPKIWWKDDIWSFWAFHDIPGLGKYGFSRSALQAENAGKTDLCIFFSRHAARFCSTLKVYCYRRRVSKIHENMRTQPAKLI